VHQTVSSPVVIKGPASKGVDVLTLALSAAGAIILKVTYGYEVQEKNDPFVSQVDLAMEQLAIVGVPGRFAVDFIPACQYHTSDFWLLLIFENSEVFARLVSRSRLQEDWQTVLRRSKPGSGLDL
jgi:hypothetical protein